MNKQKNHKNKQQQGTSLSEKLSSPPYAYLIICLVLIIIYGQVLTFYLGKFDEEGIILSNLDFLKDFHNIGKAFFRDAFFSDTGVEFYRPLQNISFMLDAHLSGSSGWGYYFMNLVYHGITCCLLYQLFNLFDFDKKLAFAVTLVFAANPLFAHLIAWAPSRGDILLGLFGILSFIYFRKYVLNGNLILLLVSVLAFLLAMLSKEPAIFFPFIYILDYFILEKDHKIHLRKLLLSLIPYLSIILLYFVLRHNVVKVPVSGQVFGLAPLIHNLRVIFEYPGKFIFPFFLAPCRHIA